MRSFAENLSRETVDSLRYGGKGAGLGRLIGFGHRVPPGFIVSVDAFSDTLHHLGLEDAIRALESSLREGSPDLGAAEDIRLSLLAGTMPADLLGEVEAAGAEHWRRSGLICRSSATVEDSGRFSFAGIFESEPISHLTELGPTLRSIWSSVFTPRAISYSAMCGLTEIPRMAVVVQEFVSADRSGVMFTTFRSPDGSDQTLVEHVAGTAEKLVKGEVTPERVWLGSGVVADHGCLSAEHVAELEALAELLETQFGGPQDVEWCIESGDLYLVQTRPVTTGLVPSTSDVPDGATLLRGLGASPGVGSGAVHLVFNIEHALAIQSGEVLVTPMTNPDMVVAMGSSAAVVTDVGGMICHAAIVSRELGLPCVVGTVNASTTLTEGQFVTVDGAGGAVLDGQVDLQVVELPRGGSADVWSAWIDGRPPASTVPLVSTIELLTDVPPQVTTLALLVDYDLRCDPRGLWRDLEGNQEQLPALLDQYLREVESMDGECNVLLTTRGAVFHEGLVEAVLRSGSERIQVLDDRVRVVVPIVLALAPVSSARRELASVAASVERMTDPTKVFGHQPTVRPGLMPAQAQRSLWWDVLPEYGRYHREHAAGVDGAQYDWVDVRPEIVISPLLKSLVQPGFEMVPRILGFSGVPPMHTKWIRGRFHFRADTFAAAWSQIVRATWEAPFLTHLMSQVRRSYDQLAEVLALFPTDEAEFRALTPERIVALITAWWPRCDRVLRSESVPTGSGRRHSVSVP